MALFAFVTDQCTDEAEHHGWQNTLDRFAASLEEKQSVGMFEPFPPPYLVKKKFGSYQGRLVAALVPVGEDSVVVLLSVMIKGTHDYDEFSTDAVPFGQRELEHLYAEKNWAAFVEERTCNSSATPKPTVSGEEYGYLHDVLHHTTAEGVIDEELVCESIEWAEKCGQP
jgi:hypothetical protein